MSPREQQAVLSKRVLVELSHAIEQYALAAAPGEPLVVIGLFQRWSYFRREAKVYGDIAGRGAVTVVGTTDDLPDQLPEGVRHCVFGSGDPLAQEWSVTALGPRGGASLVAYDQERVAADAPTIEQGRLFSGRWSFHRETAYREVLRLRTELRLPAALRLEVDAVLRAVSASPEPREQDWWDVPLRFMADRVERAVRDRDRARGALHRVTAGAERDPRTGLPTEAYLERWTTGWGEGTLPIGLVLLRLLDLPAVRAQFGMRTELATLNVVANGLRQLSGEGDQVIRVGRDDFLLVMPGASSSRAASLAHAACAWTRQLETQFPFVTVASAAVVTVARHAPLPLDRLLVDLERVAPADQPVRLLAS